MRLPVYHWDAVATVGFKAKVFLHQSSLHLLARLPHAAYPLHTPLAMTWINDLFLTYHATAAALLLVWWARREDRELLVLAGLFAALATWTKVEGLMLWAAQACVLVVIFLEKARRLSLQSRLRSLGDFLLPGIVLNTIFWSFKWRLHVPMEDKAHLILRGPLAEKFLSFAHTLLIELFLSPHWNLVWFLLVVTLLARPRWWANKSAALLLLLIGLHILALSALNTFTPSHKRMAGPLAYQGLPRMVLHIFPLVPMAVVLLNAPDRRRTAGPPP